MADSNQGTATVQQPTANGDAAAPSGGIADSMPLLIIVMWILVIYFFFMRPQKKRERERKAMVDQVKKGDKVVTIGGIHGTVTGASNNNVTLKICDKTGTTIKVSRAAINTVPSAEKETEKTEQEK